MDADVLRLSREAIRLRIALGLIRHKPAVKRAGGISGEEAQERITDDLVDRIMGDPESEAVVIVPSLAGPPLSPRRGRWGADEPHPHPDMPVSDH